MIDRIPAHRGSRPLLWVMLACLVLLGWVVFGVGDAGDPGPQPGPAQASSSTAPDGGAEKRSTEDAWFPDPERPSLVVQVRHDGVPVAGAEVIFRPSARPDLVFRAVTCSAGQAALRVPILGSGRVAVGGWTGGARVSESGLETVEVDLTRAPWKGTVFHPDGETPAADVEVTINGWRKEVSAVSGGSRLYHEGTSSCVTDSAGRFAGWAPSGDRAAAFIAPPPVPAYHTARVELVHGAKPVRVVLKRRASLDLSIRDARTLAPLVRGLVVSVVAADGSESPASPHYPGPGGSRLHLPTAESRTYVVRRAGYLPSEPQLVRIDPETGRGRLRADLAPDPDAPRLRLLVGAEWDHEQLAVAYQWSRLGFSTRGVTVRNGVADVPIPQGRSEVIVRWGSCSSRDWLVSERRISVVGVRGEVAERRVWLQPGGGLHVHTKETPSFRFLDGDPDEAAFVRQWHDGGWIVGPLALGRWRLTWTQGAGERAKEVEVRPGELTHVRPADAADEEESTRTLARGREER